MHRRYIFSVFFSSFTVDDEHRNVSELVCKFIKSVSYGKDFQKQLKFYTEVRASFFKLDPIYVILVQVMFLFY